MSNRPSKSALQELNLLAALDIVKARVDTSAIAEIQDWSGAVIGKFYGSNVELSSASVPSESSAIAHPMLVNLPSFAGHAISEGMGYAQISAPQLISICVSARDEAAWSEFVRRFQPLIMGAVVKTVRRMGNISSALVDDLVQDVYVKLCSNDFRTLKELEISNENALFGFIKVVASSVAQDYFRTSMAARSSGNLEKHESREGLYSRSLESTDANNSPGNLEREVFFKEMDRLLQAHSQDPNFERDYIIFWVYFRSGLTAKEIANLPGVGLRVKGVESVLLRMTRLIKAKLAPSAPEGKKKKNP